MLCIHVYSCETYMKYRSYILSLFENVIQDCETIVDHNTTDTFYWPFCG